MSRFRNAAGTSKIGGLRQERVFRRAAIPLIAVLLGGCAAMQSADLASRDGDPPPLSAPVWPEPPMTPRIEFVTALASERDLGREPTFAETLSEFLTGRKPSGDHLVQPMDVVVSDDGNRIYVSDFGSSSVYAFDLEERVTEKLGGDGKSWAYPFGVALDGSDNLYVVEQETKTITVLDPAGKVVRQFTHASLERPTDIEVDRERGLIYVVDGSRQHSPNHFVKVFDSEGRFLRNIGAGKGAGDGYLMFPTYLALGPEGELYVTDTVNSRVAIFDSEGKFERQIGDRGNVFGMFDKPKGVALDSFGNVYVVDSGWSNVQIFNQKGEVLLFFGGRGAFPGMMRNPTGLTIDQDNNIYVADYLNHRLDIYRLINTQQEDSFTVIPPADQLEGD